MEATALMMTGMVAIKRLRSFTGLFSWVCGCLPRLRWIVRILYAVLTEAEQEQHSGTEAVRAAKRHDKRPKLGLVASKRTGIALQFACAFWTNVRTPVVRRISSRPVTNSVVIVADASPWGLGAVLVHASSGIVLYFFESKITSFDEKALGITIGDSAAQAIVEALALLMVFHVWGPFFKCTNTRVTLRSDSSVALAIAGKLASAIPTLRARWLCSSSSLMQGTSSLSTFRAS